MPRTALLMMVMLCLTGCGSLSQEQCQAGNWQEIGYRDGRQGYQAETLDKHVRTCAEYGVMVNRDDYLQGHAQGIEAYCTPKNGRYVGLQGGSYRGVCPAALEPAFLREYRYGRDLYEILDAIQVTRGDLYRKQDLLRDERNPAVRRSLYNDINELEDVIRSLVRSYNILRQNPPRQP